MVLNQCIVKGCHSANSENKQDLSSGGKLHPVPKHVLDDPEQQKKWIELVKGSRNLTTRQGNIRNQFICEKHFDEKDFKEGQEVSADVQLNENEIMKRTLKENSVPSKNLPNQGGKQADNDYIYYDRDATDESTSLLLENSGGTNELSQISDMNKKGEANNSATKSEQEAPTKGIIATNSDEVKMITSNSSNDLKKGLTPPKLSITPTSTNAKIESRVKTVLARDKATGKKVLMKLMPVGVGGATKLSPTKGQSAIVKTLSANDIKSNITNKGGKRTINFSAKSPGINRGNMVTLNSRLLIRPHDLSLHPNSNLSPNAAKQAANQVRRQFQISGNRKISSPSIAKQNTEPPTPLKNPSLIYNELGLSNLTVGANDADSKSNNDEEKRLLRHVDSVIETIMDETRLSEGEGEISKLLKGPSQPISGDETALEFPDGETPPDVLSLAETPSGKENEEKSKSPVRFIKSSDGTIKISSVISHNSRNLQQSSDRKIALKPKGPLLIRRELGAQGPILIRKGVENVEKKEEISKESEEVIDVTSCEAKETGNEIRLESSPTSSSISRPMSFSNRIVMNQLENPRELSNLPNLTSLPKYQLETSSRVSSGNLISNAGSEVGNLELEAKRHQQIHMLIKLARVWMNKANDLEVVNARLSAGWKDAGLNPGFLEVATDKALVYWRHKAMTLNSENLTLKKELVAFIRSKGDINDETAKRYRTENSNLRAKLAARERQYKKLEKIQIKQKETITKLRKDLSGEIKERGALLRRKRNRDRRVEVNAARRRWRAQVMKELVNQNKLHPDVLKRPRIFYPPYIGQKYVDAEGNPLPKPKPFANWNKKKGVESGKLVEDIRDLPPEAFQQNQQIQQQQQFIISSPHKIVTKEGIDGEVLLAKSETDIAVASITAAGIVPGVVTIGNQQITVEGANVGTSADGHFSGVVSVDGQVAANAQYHVNQLNEELLRGGEISNNLKSAVQDAIQRMEAGNYTGNNVKNRPYRWQGKGPRPPHKQPPPKKSKKMTQMDQTLGEGDGEKVLKGKSRKAKAKTPKIAYSTTLKKVDTRTVSNVATTSNSIQRIQASSELLPHSYISTSTHPSITRKRKRKRTDAKGLEGVSDEDLVGDSDSDVYDAEQPGEVIQQQPVFQQIVPQQVVQEVIATGQSSNVEGLVGAGGGLNLIPQLGQVQYIQDTENGQIIHYQLSDQYGQILQHDPSQTQVIVTTQEGVPQEIPYQHIVATTQQDSTNTDGVYNVPLADGSSTSSSTGNNEAQHITQTVLRQNDGDVLMSFSVPYKVEATSNSANIVATSSGDSNDWQTTTVTTVIPSEASTTQ